MSSPLTVHLLVDTSYLRSTSWEHPDFRKLLEYSKRGALKIYISQIAWEEHRTQEVERIRSNADKVRSAFDALRRAARQIVLSGLTEPELRIPDETEIQEHTKKYYQEFSHEHGLEILPYHAHADRAWRRYFDAAPPFNPSEKRENRRKDIPDAWIFEAALDLHQSNPNMIALCGDSRLADALRNLPVTVYDDAAEIVHLIEPKAPEAQGAAPQASSTAEAPLSEASVDDVASALAHVGERFREIERRVLGLVGYVRFIAKDQLAELLIKLGVESALAASATDRMVVAGLILDTGNNYIPGNREICDRAAASVEADIIRLIENG